MTLTAPYDTELDDLVSSTVIRHVAVVVPARNEEDSIENCLASVIVACSLLPESVTTSIVVVSDSCDDATAERALGVLRRRCDVVLVTAVGRAGAARQVGTEQALADVDLDPREVWLATTDADTMVPPDWLVQQLLAAEEGFIGTAGVVQLDPETVTDPALLDAFSDHYVMYDDGTHPHVHGANIGFRADAYIDAGGWNPLATGEDHDLWNRLRQFGCVMSTTSTAVLTSARLEGRAVDGFARDLSLLSKNITGVA